MSDKKEHRFWSQQPVSQGKKNHYVNEINKPIEPAKDPVKDIRDKPLNLPDGYEWCELDIFDKIQIEEIYSLLYNNYVEDGDSMFRFDYSIPFLQWALSPPEYKKDWHVGVRVSSTHLLIGFITGIPVNVNIYQNTILMAEINFLCVHKKLRSKRLAPVLIREITRRINRCNIWQAVYTSGVKLPGSISTCRYYHRPINPQKLIEVGFSCLRRNVTMTMTKKLYKISDCPKTPGFRIATDADVPQIHSLLNEYLKRFDVTILFSEEDIKHWLISKQNVVYSYVVEDQETKQITDFCSFYVVPSTVLRHSVYSNILVAYAYYYASSKTDLVDLMQDALVCAKKNKIDVFNCLDIAENKQFINKLKFEFGDGNLHYYLYNWRCPIFSSEKIGLIFL
ncbi:glycylpeptide N-tetradecanoyltransferase 1-like [Schistocerca gregaria]|uniref:glycylpeptide N-tetradecanoyltransferase 1-like n=1 Tax=Schistocerca gregaria TaxID=7010 RepID=UPI00211EE8C5|nr:glycylpeptide N-tetradecanoyltransferase 1-like [Schistocerca gregaria]